MDIQVFDKLFLWQSRCICKEVLKKELYKTFLVNVKINLKDRLTFC